MTHSATLHCPQCSNGYPVDKFNQCPVCEIPLEHPAGQQQSQVFHGNHNQGIQIGGNNQAPVIINPTPPEPRKTLIHREKITPMRIGSTPVKPWWFSVSGTLGVIGSIASILSVFMALNTNEPPAIPPLPIWVTFGSMFLLIIGIGFWRYKYIPLPFTGRIVEKDKQGNLYLCKVIGTCRHCDSPVVVKVDFSNNMQTKVVCTNNPHQHHDPFDRSVLRDVGEEYRER